MNFIRQEKENLYQFCICFSPLLVLISSICIYIYFRSKETTDGRSDAQLENKFEDHSDSVCVDSVRVDSVCVDSLCVSGINESDCVEVNINCRELISAPNGEIFVAVDDKQEGEEWQQSVFASVEKVDGKKIVGGRKPDVLVGCADLLLLKKKHVFISSDKTTDSINTNCVDAQLRQHVNMNDVHVYVYDQLSTTCDDAIIHDD